MLTGIQITFMVFCWVVIFACIFSVIYSVVDMIREVKRYRHLTEREAQKILDMAEEEFLKQRDDK